MVVTRCSGPPNNCCGVNVPPRNRADRRADLSALGNNLGLLLRRPAAATTDTSKHFQPPPVESQPWNWWTGSTTAAPGAHRQHPTGRSRGTLLRHARGTGYGGVPQTKWPPRKPGRFILASLGDFGGNDRLHFGSAAANPQQVQSERWRQRSSPDVASADSHKVCSSLGNPRVTFFRSLSLGSHGLWSSTPRRLSNFRAAEEPSAARRRNASISSSRHRAAP